MQNSTLMERSYYTSPKPSWLMRMLWKAAGGDRYILERATYADQMKYMCLGGVVLATGLMAALAGGYAFYTIFVPKGDDALEHYKQVLNMATGKMVSVELVDIPTAIKAGIFGLIWGLIIFNIDRFIVTSTGKGDGTEAITWGELKSAIPRIIMGAIIALTISKPIEIRMFKSEIDAQLHEEQKAQMQALSGKNDVLFAEKIKLVEKDLGKIEEQRNDLNERIKKAEKEYTDQLQGRAGAPAGDGKLAAALRHQKDALYNERNMFDEANDTKLHEIEHNRKQVLLDKENEGEKDKESARRLDGLLERIKLAHKVAGGWISLFITLLFMAIELTPIFFKLMLVKTPYDFLDDNIKDLVKAENGIEVRYDYYKDKTGQERHLVINHEAERMIYEKSKATDLQKNLTDYALQKFEEKKKRDIDADPEAFVNDQS